MSEAASTQTPGPNTQPSNESSPSPEVTLDFEPGVKLQDKAKILQERIRILQERIGADATHRGFSDIQGLELEVRDEEGAGRRYVVSSASMQPVYKKKESIKRFSRPRIQGPLFEKFSETEEEREDRLRKGKDTKLFKFKGRHAFSREKIDTIHENVGLPRIVKRGASVEIDRPSVRVAPKYKPFVTVNIYDTANDLVTVRNMSLEEFYATAGAALTSDHGGTDFPNATWNWHNRTPEQDQAHAREDLEIGLTRGKKQLFEDISEQLESHGITNWAGLTWQLEMPGRGTTPSSDSRKRGGGVRTRIQQILEDKLVNEREFGRDEAHLVRRFVLRTTEKHEDGIQVITDERAMKDYELWHYLQEPEDFSDIAPKHSVIWNMRMPGAGRLKNQEDEAVENIASGLEVSDDPEDTRRREVEEALGILGLRGQSYPTTEAGYAALSSHIAFAMEGEERKLGEELQKVLAEVGYNYFDQAVKKIHQVMLPKLKHAMGLLDLQVTRLESEDFWVAESLLERSSKERARHTASPLEAILHNPGLVREIIDEHVGFLFSQESIIKHPVTTQKGIDSDGKPKLEEKIVHEFDEKMFRDVRLMPPVGAKGSYPLTKGVMKWHDKIWGEIKKQAYGIYESLEEGEPIEYTAYQRLGRMLRRTIGQ